MLKWLAAIGIVLLQETVLLNGLLVEAHKGVFPEWIIPIMFVTATLLDMAVGYSLGKFVRKKWPEGRFVALG